jgi:sortase (surface protein transpeptidase)
MKIRLLLEKRFLHTRQKSVRYILLGKTQKHLNVSRVKKDVLAIPFHTSRVETVKITPKLTPNLALKPTIKKSFPWRALLFVFFSSCSLVLMSVLFGPALYYHFFPSDPVPLKSTEDGTPLGGRFDQGRQQTVRQVNLPAYDETLPDGTWLIIPRIGVRTEILEGETSDEALSKGVWRVPDFGEPGDTTKPIILAAHRYGYLSWWQKNSEYWRYHSFYLLPNLEPGDLVEVISQKRKYLYEIYAGEEGTEISDYNADMILYTCKFLNADTRFFRYARLVDPTKDTQSQQKATVQEQPTKSTDQVKDQSKTPAQAQNALAG